VSWGQVIFLLAVVNMSLGLINLIPLLPFDGGHAAVATYEAVRSRKGRPYRVDISKLLPITYAVVGVLLVFGLTSIFLDIRSPITGP
jgi:membrane-associated protease RseP (regulator of RpoE activity)